jgi:hypothetical protein
MAQAPPLFFTFLGHLAAFLNSPLSLRRGAEGNPIAPLCRSLGLHTHEVPADACALYDHSGLPVPKHVELQAHHKYFPFYFFSFLFIFLFIAKELNHLVWRVMM